MSPVHSETKQRLLEQQNKLLQYLNDWEKVLRELNQEVETLTTSEATDIYEDESLTNVCHISTAMGSLFHRLAKTPQDWLENQNLQYYQDADIKSKMCNLANCCYSMLSSIYTANLGYINLLKRSQPGRDTDLQSDINQFLDSTENIYIETSSKAITKGWAALNEKKRNITSLFAPADSTSSLSDHGCKTDGNVMLYNIINGKK